MIRPIGVLALQGDFAAHGQALEASGARWEAVRTPRALESVSGLVIPGGESTTILRAVKDEGFEEALRAFRSPVLATCAGLILLAREVLNPAQPSLALLDVACRRNAYGRQNESFIGCGRLLEPPEEDLELVFIRAPRIESLGPGVKVLMCHDRDPVLVEEGLVTACTFHPELSPSRRLHERFVARCREASP